MAQETKNPQRNMPIGILGSLAVCTVLFVLFGHVLTRPSQPLQNSAAPVAIAIEKKRPTPGTRLGRDSGHLIGYTSVILVDCWRRRGCFLDVERRAAVFSCTPRSTRQRSPRAAAGGIVRCLRASLFR
jgi:APA family basic amino acid/polyamine antiporter